MLIMCTPQWWGGIVGVRYLALSGFRVIGAASWLLFFQAITNTNAVCWGCFETLTSGCGLVQPGCCWWCSWASSWEVGTCFIFAAKVMVLALEFRKYRLRTVGVGCLWRSGKQRDPFRGAAGVAHRVHLVCFDSGTKLKQENACQLHCFFAL